MSRDSRGRDGMSKVGGLGVHEVAEAENLGGQGGLEPPQNLVVNGSNEECKITE